MLSSPAPTLIVSGLTALTYGLMLWAHARMSAAQLRSLLVLGARSLLHAAKDKTDSVSRWALALAERRGYWKAVVAIAAKNARMAWAVLSLSPRKPRMLAMT